MTMTVADIAWYVLRVTYGREIPLKKYLDDNQIENFIPMQYQMIEKNGKKSKKLLPVIHNLIFVKTSKQTIDEFKPLIELKMPVRYIMDRSKKLPMVVPECQMQHFIAVSGTCDENLVYLKSSINFKRGMKVRIKSGIFAGVEGEFVRIKGDRRVVVAINGIMAVATAFVHPSMVEEIKA
ncbi:MAG: UpxY family transcription antiterminator [Prevotellaceae bacterium]|jgi:transcription antitermination factor NusG|nr:UpxY family transcription antiterminator [Prevotellaceae bacterium]